MEEEFEPTVETVKFGDLPEDLKDEVIQHFQNDEFLVQDDWYQWMWEDFISNSSQLGIEIDSESLSFDMNYGISLEYSGTIDDNHKEISKFKSDELGQFETDEWVYDIDASFDSQSIGEDYHIDIDTIYSAIESDIFPNEEINDDGMVEIQLNTTKTIMDGAKKHGLTEHKFIEELVNGIEAASLFFQDVHLVAEDKYTDFLNEIVNEVESDAESAIEEYKEQVNGVLEELHEQFGKDLQSQYDYHWDDEYAKENLENKTFEVETDEDGEKTIDDLMGDW